MIVEIKCTTCGAVMGTLEKTVITQEDIDLYALSMECPAGHITVALDEVVEP